MTFSSILYSMCTNPNHSNFNDMAYNSEYPVYYLKNNTVYKRLGVWNRGWRNWLEENGVPVDDDRAVYHPVINVQNGIITTWETQIANIGNKMLDMGESNRKVFYPNLYFVQIGNHPYPKEARFHKCWQLDTAQRECHRIIYPHHDPKQFFLLPKDLDY